MNINKEQMTDADILDFIEEFSKPESFPDHDCHASPEDGCAGCEALLNAPVKRDLPFKAFQIHKGYANTPPNI